MILLLCFGLLSEAVLLREPASGQSLFSKFLWVQQAAAAAAEKAAKQREFTLGKLAYGKGQYNTSVQLFTQALDREGPFSPLGGEIQLWLALAYQVSCRSYWVNQGSLESHMWRPASVIPAIHRVCRSCETGLKLQIALQATGREQDCIDLYKALENTHPNANIKKQAANLRFIMEAPKLKLGPDERVSIPVIDTSDRFV